ncbi:MAG TPA: methylamine utilization protein [Thermoanaerobaculia bacterium]|nr:methylamine utilization protein [Thermoanaerobaculia bacterium]
MLRPLALVLLALALPAGAATIDAVVRDARGRGVAEAVVYAVPEGRELPPARKTAVMDQRNREFIPHVLVVQSGTAVNFPNSDDVRHQVYSFSPAKTFQLPLYKGTPANAIVFDKAGVATLGCNIHDRMTAYIVVVDTPHFGTSGRDGKVTLPNLAGGKYAVRVWYPEMKTEPSPIAVTVTGNERTEVSFVAR